jgi:hypothetical protein
LCGGRIDDDLKEYDLENYDEPTEEEKKTGEGMRISRDIVNIYRLDD